MRISILVAWKSFYEGAVLAPRSVYWQKVNQLTIQKMTNGKKAWLDWVEISVWNAAWKQREMHLSKAFMVLEYNLIRFAEKLLLTIEVSSSRWGDRTETNHLVTKMKTSRSWDANPAHLGLQIKDCSLGPCISYTERQWIHQNVDDSNISARYGAE